MSNQDLHVKLKVPNSLLYSIVYSKYNFTLNLFILTTIYNYKVYQYIITGKSWFDIFLVLVRKYFIPKNTCNIKGTQ